MSIHALPFSVSATRPLLRQIENLQSTYNAQSSSYEKVEKNLTDRLGIIRILLFFILAAVMYMKVQSRCISWDLMKVYLPLYA